MLCFLGSKSKESAEYYAGNKALRFPPPEHFSTEGLGRVPCLTFWPKIALLVCHGRSAGLTCGHYYMDKGESPKHEQQKAALIALPIAEFRPPTPHPQNVLNHISVHFPKTDLLNFVGDVGTFQIFPRKMAKIQKLFLQGGWG